MRRWPEVCFSLRFCLHFSEGRVRTQSRGVRCESGSRCKFAPQSQGMRCKMECPASGKCEFYIGNTGLQILNRKLATRCLKLPFGLIRGPLVSQIAIHSRRHSILWRHKRVAWVDFGPQGSGKRHPIRAQTSALRAQC